MTRHERRRYEMLTRVQAFGKAHRDQFPEGSLGTSALVALDEAVERLTRLDAEKVLATTEGRKEKALARKALVAQFVAMSRTARVLAGEMPGVDGTFALPARRPDVALLSAARACISRADMVQERFRQHGLDMNAFQEATDAFEQAIRSRQTGRNDSAGAQAGIKAALDEGAAAVRRLDVIVSNTLGGNPLIVARWKQARRIASTRTTSTPDGGEPMSLPDAPATEAPAQHI